MMRPFEFTLAYQKTDVFQDGNRLFRGVRWLLEEGWGHSFGVFAWTRADIETQRRHFRRLLQVKDESGKRLFFRYYDPRVLRLYLPTCTAGELKQVFGPVERFITEGEAGQVIAYERGGRSLRVIETRVSATDLS